MTEDTFINTLVNRGLHGELPTHAEALHLAEIDCCQALDDAAAKLRDHKHPTVITYSKKVFFPLTHLCRDVCHYCTFAQTPKHVEQPYLTIEDVISNAREAAAMGCKEALFTLGEKPEHRYSTAKSALNKMGYPSTLHYLKDVAEKVFTETGILPHLNPGCMTAEELQMLKPVAASMGIMLESGADRLCEKGMPHFGSPDKVPAVRLATLEEAGKQNIPFTTGILI
ncbi:MAG: 7,8-didemethyl-8-hydroxy-5-deazariboflavin synthase CofG, partial [Pseudomonadales bacterium]|nr:7,8-didemethyl-8-hydroxy-5-deazariboflavin synthase CofG [Pseudomonadales bacterium]